MAKVDWITWKTDTREIINPENIINDINDVFQNYNVYMNSIVYEGIHHEIVSGGLDQSSLNVSGVSPAYQSAISIINNIEDIKRTIEELKNKIYKSTLEQKQIEKAQLIKAIEDKIDEEKNILKNTNILKEKITKSNNIMNIKDVDDIIDSSNEKIKRLEERLVKAQDI